MRKSVEYKRKNVVYHDEGEGNVIILLHGYLETSEVWTDFIPGLVKYFRVISVDLPGHGESSVYGKEHSMEFMAEAVRTVMDEEGIEKVMLTGHSMGGYVALAFLEKYASRLYAYCLFHSHPFADTDEAVANRRREIKIVESGKKDMIYPVNIPRMFADFNIEKFEKEVERNKKIASGIPADGILAVLYGMISRPSRLRLLERGDIPLLMIAGRYDNYIPFERMTESISLPDNAEILILEESGHMGFVEEREKALRGLVDFYRKQL